jgi:hypothetical protein
MPSIDSSFAFKFLGSSVALCSFLAAHLRLQSSRKPSAAITMLWRQVRKKLLHLTLLSCLLLPKGARCVIDVSHFSFSSKQHANRRLVESWPPRSRLASPSHALPCFHQVVAKGAFLVGHLTSRVRQRQVRGMIEHECDVRSVRCTQCWKYRFRKEWIPRTERTMPPPVSVCRHARLVRGSQSSQTVTKPVSVRLDFERPLNAGVEVLLNVE